MLSAKMLKREMTIHWESITVIDICSYTEAYVYKQLLHTGKDTLGQ